MKERWRSVSGWDGFYEVSDYGRVRSLDRVIMRSNGWKQTFRGKVLANSTDDNGYPQCTLMRPGESVQIRVHTLVCREFRGKCPAGYEVRHLDGKEGNCRLTNLKYGTCAQNAMDRIQHQTSGRGEKNSQSVLTRRQVLSIRRSYARGNVLQKELAERYGVSNGTISMITRRKVWSWL